MNAHTSSESQAVPVDLQAHLIRKLNKETDRSLILAELVEIISKTLGASACSIFTIDPGDNRATQQAGSGYQKQFNGKRDVVVVPANQVQEKPERGQELGLAGWILSTGKPFLAETPSELSNHPHHSGRFDSDQVPSEKLEIETFLGVPIRGLRGEIIGVIKAERQCSDGRCTPRNPPIPFSVEDELALETIARIASRFLTYLTMAKDGKEGDAITAWARDVISETAATEGELDAFLDLAAKVTAAAMRADSCGIFLKDESGKTLTQRAGIGSQALKDVIRAYGWPDESRIAQCKEPIGCCPPNCVTKQKLDKAERIGLTAWIAATGKSFHARNQAEIAGHCHHRGEYDKWNFPNEQIGAFFGVPLQIGGRIIGVVKVENTTRKDHNDPRDFSLDAKQRFEILAQDIALSIKRLQKQIPARYRIIQEAQDTILEILRGGLELPVLVEKVVKDTRKLFHAGACALFLKEGNKLVQPRWAASGWAELGPKTRSYDLVPADQIKENPENLDEKVGLTVWIASRQEKFTARSHTELKMHPHHKGTFDADNFKVEVGERCESFMGFPMVIKRDGKNELVGVLKVETKKKMVGNVEEITYFNELDEIVFGLIARSAAIAIQNTRLQQAAAEATQNAAWQEFSAMAAHRAGSDAADIRGGLRWLSNDLSRTTHFAKADPHLRRIDDALRRIDTFVHELTRLTPVALKPERVSVNEICRQALSGFPSSPTLQLELNLSNDLPDVWADREKLLYAFNEMSQNAIKAMDEKGGKLTVSTMALDAGAKVRIEFKDTGPGVKLAFKEKIFEPGFKDRPRGTGLGLAIVAKTARQHNGTVSEIGESGTGARFILDLPVLLPEGGKERILIVEDSDNVRNDLEKIVKWDLPNRQIVTARNEVDATAKILASAFDVVITDINLEEADGTSMGGLAVIQAALKKNPDTAVIVVSAYGNMIVPRDLASGTASMSAEETARQIGCYAFIPRPHPTKDYLDVVKETVDSALTPRKRLK
jgi:signal transduction histidine kinase/CheY-like chemotaxis protein